MQTRLLQRKPRRVCKSCGFIHFIDPKVGVGVLVVDSDRVLLVRRAEEPERGKWSLPAGYLDHGDDPEHTAIRETFEETNLKVKITRLLNVYHNSAQQGASVFILYQAYIVGGELRAADDASDARFFPLDGLPELAFASTQDAVGRLSTHRLDNSEN